MAGRGIGPDDKYTAGFFDLRDGVRHGTTAESGSQTGHRGGMSETCAVINVVGADGGPGKFLGQVIFFIGDFGRNQNADRVRAVLINYAAETIGRKLNGLVPVGFDESTKRFDKRLLQAQETVDVFVKVPAFYAQLALIDRMGFDRQRAGDFTVNNFK